MTGANSVASFQKRHSRRSFDNCGSAPTSRDLSNRKVPQEWRGDHACRAASGITGGPITLAICFHGDLSTRGPHLGLGPSVDGRAVHGAVLYGARQKRAKWSELKNGESTGQQQLGIRRHSSRGVSPSSRTECSSVFRSREATAPAEGSARVSTSSSAQLPPAAASASDKSATAAPQYGTTTTASSAARAGNNFAVAHSPAATLPRRHLRHYSVWCDSPASCHTPSLLGVLQRTPGSGILNFQSNPGL
jgi:hypothetical protein